jgi:hypothetical protein
MHWTRSDPEPRRSRVTAGLGAVLAMGRAQGLAAHRCGRTPGHSIAALGLPRQLAGSPPHFDPDRWRRRARSNSSHVACGRNRSLLSFDSRWWRDKIGEAPSQGCSDYNCGNGKSQNAHFPFAFSPISTKRHLWEYRAKKAGVPESLLARNLWCNRCKTRASLPLDAIRRARKRDNGAAVERRSSRRRPLAHPAIHGSNGQRPGAGSS